MEIFQIIPEDNPTIAPLLDLFSKIPHKGDKITLDSGTLSLKSLLPRKCASNGVESELCSFLPSEDMQNYYTYDGSLTTPMCYESVRWIVFRERMGLSKRQVNRFSLSSRSTSIDHCLLPRSLSI